MSVSYRCEMDCFLALPDLFFIFILDGFLQMGILNQIRSRNFAHIIKFELQFAGIAVLARTAQF